MTTRTIEWFVFKINVLTSKKIDWSKKTYYKSQRINNILISFEEIFEMNKSSNCQLESLSNKNIRDLIKKEYPKLKKQVLVTSKLKYNKDKTILKQGIFLIDSSIPNKSINQTIFDSDLSKSLHKTKKQKYNLIQGILDNKVNHEYLQNYIIIGNDNNKLKLLEILKNLENYFKLLEIRNIPKNDIKINVKLDLKLLDECSNNGF